MSVSCGSRARLGDCFEAVGGYDETGFPVQYLRAIAP